MIYYIIRHKSGQIMPLMKRGRGYTSWNPNNPKSICHAVTDTPRLFKTVNMASRSRDAWINWPNMEYHYYGDRMKVVTQSDNRSPWDLEVVKVTLSISRR